MTGVHVSIAALLVAVGQLLTAIGQKNAPAFYASSPRSWLASCHPFWPGCNPPRPHPRSDQPPMKYTIRWIKIVIALLISGTGWGKPKEDQ